MKWKTEISLNDIKGVQDLVEQQSSHPIVRDRYRKNVYQPPPSIKKENVWLSVVMCLITTQNKSGSGSAVDNFLGSKPFPLSLEKLRSVPDIEQYTFQTLSQLRIRRWKLSAEYAVLNYRSMMNRGWDIVAQFLDELYAQRLRNPESNDYSLERSAAVGIQEIFKGIGPKQSRNFWQDLGMTRFEIPLDSRILRWCLRAMDFHIPSSGLSNEKFYHMIMDAIRELCLKANVLPCIFDAAIFSSFEN